ncbi:hypothetical protein GCM10010508_03790 [Streptomyces naganishii JCM 4654]|uniref:Uncharacterized protein n=1 Tax=Streptomyces naganishii JCM 4654 TaxID=1306179 RepID=A0A918XYL2_9ACTN|nr:hypothetical protein GCM10010508_03790 [Streptomyces naganishii JCM 4654]
MTGLRQSMVGLRRSGAGLLPQAGCCGSRPEAVRPRAVRAGRSAGARVPVRVRERAPVRGRAPAGVGVDPQVVVRGTGTAARVRAAGVAVGRGCWSSGML